MRVHSLTNGKVLFQLVITIEDDSAVVVVAAPPAAAFRLSLLCNFLLVICLHSPDDFALNVSTSSIRLRTYIPLDIFRVREMQRRFDQGVSHVSMDVIC